jgi:hypothetical protein
MLESACSDILQPAATRSHHGTERLGSGDGEGWTLNTRQTAYEPLPASVLFVPDGRFRSLGDLNVGNGMSGCCRMWQSYVGARRNGRLKMADQKFRGVAVCVDVIGGDDRRPCDPIVVFGVQ